MVNPEIIYAQDTVNRFSRFCVQMYAFVCVYNSNNKSKESHQFEEERGVWEKDWRKEREEWNTAILNV